MAKNNEVSGGGPERVVALAADMLFSSRIRGTAQVVGVPVRLARQPADVHAAVRAGARMALLDLDSRSVDVPALIRTLREEFGSEIRIIAFVSHVRTDAIEAARHAGADSVMARSGFVRELATLLGSAAPS